MHFCSDEAMALIMFLSWFPGIRWIRMWWAKRRSEPAPLLPIGSLAPYKCSITPEWVERVAENTAAYDDDVPPTGRP